MSGAVHFIQQCPTCGRRLQVQLQYMGRQLNCEHCHGTFVAGAHQDDGPESPMDRASQLLASLDTMRLESNNGSNWV